MSKAASPIPAGYHTVTPYICVKGADKTLDFLKRAFDADVVNVSKGPDGSIMNAEFRIGSSMLMIAEARDHFGPRPATTYMYVENVDELYERAIEGGAKSLMAPVDQFYGDRSGGVEDVGGNQWWIATRIEDLTADEIARRAQSVKR